MDKRTMKKKRKSHYIVPIKTKPSKGLPTLYVLDEDEIQRIGIRLFMKKTALK